MNKYYDISLVQEVMTGPVPSLNTLFNKDGSLDWTNMGTLLDFQIANGAKSILITQGDSCLSNLTDQETADLVKFVVETVNKRAMVIGGGKIWCHSKNLEFAEYCREIGCDVLLPVLPDWAQSLDINLAVDCYKELGKIMPIMMMTNLMNGRGIPLGIYDMLEPDCGIVAVKDDTAMPYGRDMGVRIKDKFVFFSGGGKHFFLSHAPYGCKSYLSSFGRMLPEISNRFWECYSTGRLQEAYDVVTTYEVPLMNFWHSGGRHFDATFRAMYEILGLGQRWRRTPYSSYTDEQMEELRAFMQSLKLI